MKKEQEIEIEEYLNKIPPLYRNIHKKALNGKSKATGVKAKCLDCCCWDRLEVKFCESVTCPLYPYKPKYK